MLTPTKPPGIANALIGRIGHREELEIPRAVGPRRDEPVAELVQVVVDLRVVEIAAGAVDLPHHGLAQPALLRRRNNRLRLVTEIGQGRHHVGHSELRHRRRGIGQRHARAAEVGQIEVRRIGLRVRSARGQHRRRHRIDEQRDCDDGGQDASERR